LKLTNISHRVANTRDHMLEGVGVFGAVSRITGLHLETFSDNLQTKRQIFWIPLKILKKLKSKNQLIILENHRGSFPTFSLPNDTSCSPSQSLRQSIS
jgi:hypothetical protein